jgi:hypothetical protein
MLKRCGPGEPKSSRMGFRFDYNLNLCRGEEYIPIKGVWTSECIAKDCIPLLCLVLAVPIPILSTSYRKLLKTRLMPRHLIT